MSIVTSARMAIVFNFDGTLVDSLADTTTAINHVLSEFGYPNVPETTVAEHINAEVNEVMSRCVGRPLEPGSLDEMVASYIEYHAAHPVEHTVWVPGAVEAVENIDAQPVIWTNKPFRVTEAILKSLARSPSFQFVVAGGEYRWSKPHPMLFGIITDRVRVAPNHLVVISDSWQDIEAGRDDGAYTVGVLCGYGDRTRLQESNPDAVISSLWQLPEVVMTRARQIHQMEGWPLCE